MCSGMMTERETLQAWSVRRCPNKGIEEISGYRTSDRYFMEKQDRGWGIAHRIGVDVFFSRDEAVAAAKVKCKKRIAALKRQIDKLKQKEFS